MNREFGRDCLAGGSVPDAEYVFALSEQPGAIRSNGNRFERDFRRDIEVDGS